jgi:hypothetical protein
VAQPREGLSITTFLTRGVGISFVFQGFSVKMTLWELSFALGYSDKSYL